MSILAALAVLLVVVGTPKSPAAPLGTAAAAPEYDFVLRGGTVYDGGGGKPFVGDVAVRGDRIAKVGDLGKFCY